MNFNNTYNLKLTADGLPIRISCSYTFFFCRRADSDFEISMDGENWFPMCQGEGFGPLDEPANNLYARAINGVDQTVTVRAGTVKNTNSPAAFVSDAQGNLGVADAAAAAGTLPACDGNGFLQIPAVGVGLTSIPNTRQGKKQTEIIFTLDANAARDLRVFDKNGRSLIRIKAGQQIRKVTADMLKIGGDGGTVGVTISQVFV